MPKTKEIVAFVTLLSLSLACSEEENLKLNLYIVQGPTGTSPYCTQPAAGTTTKLATGKYDLRLTYMRRGAPGEVLEPLKLRKKFTITCDRLIKPGEVIDILVPTDVTPRYTLRVDVFEETKGSVDKYKLVYTGQMQDLDVSKGELTVYLRPTGALTCADRMVTPRAFHTATLLPNGQVLVLGGMVAEASGQAEKLHADDTELAYTTGKAEIYDPDTMKFVELDEEITPQRAFHQTFLMPSPASGPYEVLVVGGVAPAQKGGAALLLKAGSLASINYPFLITPSATAEASGAGIVTITPPAAGSEGKPKLSYTALSNIPKVLFPRATLTNNGSSLLVAGGGASYTESGASKGFTASSAACWVEMKAKTQRSGTPKIEAQIKLNRTRVGHAVAALGLDRYAVVGGTMDGPGPCTAPNTPAGCDSSWEANNIGEVLSQGTTTAAAKLMSFSGTPPEPSAWHTLTTIGVKDGDTSTAPEAALLAGGFSLGRETDALRTVNDQLAKSKPLMVIKDGTSQTATAITDTGTGAFQHAGYHDAVSLDDGSVLLSGGNVNSNFIKTAPCDKFSSQFCAYSQLSIYELSGGAVSLRSASVNAMTLGRFGHRTVRLMDNTLLFTGGVTLTEEVKSTVKVYTPVLTTYAEVYNPRWGTLSEDPFDRKAGQDYDTANKETGHTCTQQEQ